MQLNAQIVSDSVCAGDSGLVKYFVSNVQTGTTHTWSLNGGGTIALSTNDTLGVTWGEVPGIYEISVSGINQDGCISPADVYKIKVINRPNLLITPSSPVICLGDSVLLSVSGGTNYNWAPSTNLSANTGSSVIANPLETSTYTVTGSLETCTSTASVTISVNRFPNVGFTFNQTGNYLVQFNNTTTNGNTYLWDFGSGSTSTEENPIASYPFEGTYLATLISTNSCGSDTLTQDVTLLKLGLNELNGSTVSIGPNPFQDRLTLSIRLNAPEPLTLSLYDLVGKLVIQEFLPTQKDLVHQVDVSMLSSGMYLLRLSKGDEQITLKVLKEN